MNLLTLFKARSFININNIRCIAVKRSRLQNRVSNIVPKKVLWDQPQVAEIKENDIGNSKNEEIKAQPS